MRLAATLRRAARAALSQGHGYEPHPPGEFVDFGAVAGYFIDYTAKTRNAGREADYQPADLAQLALGWWERLLAGDASAGDAFLHACDRLERRALASGEGLLWSYQIDLPKYGIRAPWSSAMTQGQAASVFVRAHALTSKPAYAAAARRALAPLLAPRSRLISLTEAGPVLEEAEPGAVPSHILNGWVFALWGLWDVQLALGDQGPREVFDASARCLVSLLDRYDVGWWTRYSLYPLARRDLAKPFYHRLHVTQMGFMHRLTGAEEFAAAARRWRRYDRPDHVAAALASKLPDLLTELKRA